MIEPKQNRAAALTTALAIIACLGGGGAFAWWVAQDATGDRIVVLDRAPGDGVTKAGADQWRITAGSAVVQVTAPSGDATPTFEFYFAKFDFLTPDDIATLTIAKRLVSDRAFAAAADITPAQMSELRDIRKQAKISLSADDERRLAAAWPDYAAATSRDGRRGPEDALIRIVEQITERVVGPAKQSAIERAGKVKTILTAEQWAKLDNMGQ